MASQNQNSSLNLHGCSSRETLISAKQSKNVLENMRSSYKEKKQCDIVLIAKIDNSKVHAHKICLSASSEYFRGMFRSGMNEAKADEIKLEDIDGETLTSIVVFIYTASIELRNDTVESVLIGANRFQVNNLIDACSDFIDKRLDIDNCLGIALFAKQQSVTSLCKKATTFALQHFETVCKEKEFLDLNKEQLNALISSDHLCVSSEEKVFLSLVAWVEYDKENREALIFDIFSQVRFTFLEPKFIIKNRHSVCKTIEWYEMICSWLQWHLSPESRSEYPIEMIKPRTGHEKLAFVRGEDTDNLELWIFDRDLNTWSFVDLPRSSKNRWFCGSIAINNKLIIAGGYIDDLPTNTVECYDFQTKKWTDLPPMRCERVEPGMAELCGELYVFGDATPGDCWSRLVEKYDFATGKWQEVAPLLTPFKFVKVVALDGLLYAVGDCASTMECYDPDINQWTQKTFKNGKSIWFDIAGVSGYLYAVGGEYAYNEGFSRTVERYNPSTDTWTEISSLRIGLKSISCAALNNRLIACGEHDDVICQNLVEEYDPVTSEWTTLAPLKENKVCNILGMFPI